LKFLNQHQKTQSKENALLKVSETLISEDAN